MSHFFANGRGGPPGAGGYEPARLASSSSVAYGGAGGGVPRGYMHVGGDGPWLGGGAGSRTAQLGAPVCESGLCSNRGPDAGAGMGGEQGCTSCFSENVPNGMAYVGYNKGDFMTDTTYRYVGEGVGEFRMATVPRYNWRNMCAASFVVVVAFAVVAFVAVPTEPTTTHRLHLAPTPPPIMMIKDCTLWGDPHLDTWDGARPSFYGDGEFWIVKSDLVKIQGRYMGTNYTHGLAATHKMVVSGPWINDNKIEVGSLEYGDVEINDLPVLTTFGSRYTLPGGFGFVEYNDEGELVDEAQGGKPRRVVHMSLPDNITITVFRWQNYIDLKIESPPRADFDGGCGNFNGDPDDDDTPSVMARVGTRIATGDLLFSKRERIEFTPEMQAMLDTLCDKADLDNGELACREETPSDLQKKDGDMLSKSCIFDYCFGMNEHALRAAKKLG